jgi:hypothetical protein
MGRPKTETPKPDVPVKEVKNQLPKGTKLYDWNKCKEIGRGGKSRANGVDRSIPYRYNEFGEPDAFVYLKFIEVKKTSILTPEQAEALNNQAHNSMDFFTLTK